MESESTTRTIETGVHGRYLVRVPDTPGPWPALFSFHGYGEDAATNMTALHRIPDVNGWLLVAVQALHPFYTKSERVVASWMTRQDRELAIADNLAYVTAVVEAVQREFEIVTSAIAFAGFSQGGAMAYRATAHRAAAHPGAGGVIVLAADVPPDVSAPGSLPLVLIGRGRADDWYTEEKMAADLGRLAQVAASVETCAFDGGHEWTDAFASAAGAFLNRIHPPTASADARR
jgi:predicted esterase